MLHRAQIRRLPLIRVALLSAAIVLSIAPARAEEDAGDVFLTFENDDLRGARSAGEALWLQPVSTWLDVELGGRYAEFDEASWGYGIAGFHVKLPVELGHASLRYEAGAGQTGSGHYEHQIGEFTWMRALWRQAVFLDAGLQLIRVGRVHDDLGKVGLWVAPTDWLSLRGGYLHSLFNGEKTDGWSLTSHLQLADVTILTGYARSRDSVDLRSLGRGRVRGDAADEYTVGVTLPFAPHGLTLVATRYEGADTRHTLGFTWRWSLSRAPWRFDPRDESVAAH